ncbi:pilus assembly protein TadG-related protein [Yoonia sp. SS1-5]|uniref:Pilus assembly protein TadG-related protein n=1 Tax=Yoonia rhodophyticola TaxID=3137370 RepID=A0AAN0MGC1_9RHOB
MRSEILRKFGREEDGSVIVLTIVLLIIMLVLGGMAVDFMRFESRRALLQSVSDRAVLAAAELDQQLDAKEVVKDYFKKAGFENTIVGEPTVGGDGVNSRSVGVEAKLDIETFYLRFLGIGELAAPAVSGATEGVGNVEISLIVDVSGSMYSVVTGESVRKIDRLQEAATSFIDQLLVDEYDGQVSVSLVPYSEHVSVGPEIFSAIGASKVTYTDDPDPATGTSDYYTANDVYCVEIPKDEYSTTTFNPAASYTQVRTWQSNQFGFGGWEGTPGTRDYTNGVLDQPLCPNDVNERIIAISDNKTDLTTAIAGLRPRGGTSIFLGMKWGVTLLDPSFRTQAAGLTSVPSEFKNTRPSNYPQDDPNSSVAKYVVLMTDGQNSSSSRIASEHYDNAEYAELWNTYNFPFMWYNANYLTTDLGNQLRALEGQPFNGGYGTVRDGLIDPLVEYTEDEGDRLLQNICTKAREQNIIVFTIAMDAQQHGRDEMKECASKPSELYYFETSGKELVAIFDKIAEQITDLRLNL